MGFKEKAIQKIILKPMLNVALSAYKQGKEDSEKGEYDEAEFKCQIKELIKKQF